jgi:hypothetical protein
MPREQRTSLNKSPVTEVALGTLTSGVDQTVNMPIVQPVKSAGQSLAEGLGVAAKGAAKIYQVKVDEKNKSEAARTKLEHELSGNNQGDLRGREAADAVSNLMIDGKPATNQQKHEAVMQTIGSLKFTDDMSADFYRAYYKAVVRPLDALEKSWRTKSIADAKTAQVEANDKLALGNIYDGTMTGNQIIDIMRTSDAYTNAELLTKYVDMVVSNGKMLQNLAIEDPSLHTFDKDAYFAKYLHIKVGENTPGGALDLRSNPSTGDKIRAFKTYLTSDNNKAFTANTQAYKELTKALELNPETTPIAYNKHIKAGANLGYYNDTKNNPEVANLQAKFDAKYVKAQVTAVTKELSNEEIEVEKTLAKGDVYVNKDVDSLLKRHTKVLEKQVAMGIKTPAEASKEIKDLLKTSKDNTAHKTHMASFSVLNNNNVSITHLPDKTKAEVKRNVLEGLTAALEDGDIGKLVNIANNNTKFSKAFLVSNLPTNTTDIDTVTKGLQLWKKIRREEGGSNALAPLPNEVDQHYRLLEFVRPLDDDITVSQDEINRVSNVIDRVGGRAFSEKLRKTHEGKQALTDAVIQLPSQAATDMYSLYDYAREFMLPSEAVEYVTGVIFERFYRTVERPKGAEDWLYGDDITFINASAFGDEATTPDFALGVLQAFDEKFDLGTEDLLDDVRLVYDEDSDDFVLGHTSGGPGKIDLFRIPGSSIRKIGAK